MGKGSDELRMTIDELRDLQLTRFMQFYSAIAAPNSSLETPLNKRAASPTRKAAQPTLPLQASLFPNQPHELRAPFGLNANKVNASRQAFQLQWNLQCAVGVVEALGVQRASCEAKHLNL